MTGPRPSSSSSGGFGLALLTAAIVVVVGTLTALLLTGLWGLHSYKKPGPALVPTTVVLERGSSLTTIADTLARAGVVRRPQVFFWAVKLQGEAGSLKAGEYRIPARASPAEIFRLIQSGQVVQHKITIPEGWTSQQILRALQKEPLLTGPMDPVAEGMLLPDTYTFQRGEPRQAVLDRMRAAQVTLMANLWPTRQAGLPITTPEEAITLASIVEKETGLAAERPLVASVFINRLRKGMRLESDPTIIYGISQGEPLGRGLRRSEIDRKTAYNTYQIDGLPPTPIANPGREAIKAVLNPPESPYLFFVADGSGGHAFSETYAGHRQNVVRWRQIEASQIKH